MEAEERKIRLAKIREEIEAMRTEDKKLIETNKATKTETEEKNQIGKDDKIKENDYEKENKRTKTYKTIGQFLIFGVIALGMIYLKEVRTPENKTLELWLTFSILANIMILFISLFTGTGTEIYKRYFNKFKYKSGKYVNALIILKSGVVKEVFTAKDELTGSIRLMGKPYVTTAKLMFNYKGIPTYLFREDNPDPVNIWQDGYTGIISCSEVDTVMASADSFNAIAWLKQYVNYAAIGLAIIIAIGGFSANLIYEDNKALQDTGIYKATTEGVTCKMIVPVTQTDKTQLTTISGTVKNNTANNTLQSDDLR